MKAFAQWAMQSRLRATATAFVCMATPLLFWLGAALVGLVILRQGWRGGRNVLAWAVLPAIAWVSIGAPTPLMAILGANALAVTLQQTVRLDYTLYLATGLGRGMSLWLLVLMPEVLELAAIRSKEVIEKSLADQPE